MVVLPQTIGTKQGKYRNDSEKRRAREGVMVKKMQQKYKVRLQISIEIMERYPSQYQNSPQIQV